MCACVGAFGIGAPRSAVLTRVLRVRSTIGAGDTFVAGMLYALHADGWSPGERLEFAVGLATRKVHREGFAGLVTSNRVFTQ